MPVGALHRATRRRALAAGAAGAVGLFGGTLLGGVAAAAPRRSSGKIKLFAQVSWQGGVNYEGTVQALTEDFIARNWASRHPGVEVTTVAGPGSNGSAWAAGATFAAALSGDGPDIVVACCTDMVAWQSEGLLVPLEPLLRSDNIDTSIYPYGVMQSLTSEAGVVQLPDYIATVPMFVNLGALDELGLPYPAPDWTYEEATKLWRAIAGVRHKQQVYGAALGWNGADGAAISWIVHGWGGRVRDPSHTRCLLNSAPCVAALEWLVPLLQEKVVLDQFYPTNPEPAVFQTCGSWEIQWVTLNLRGLKWDFLQTPVFPAGPSGLVLNGSYGISAFSRKPLELVWDLFKFLTVEKPWQRFFNARLAFATPNQLTPDLWSDWAEIVRSVAPELRDKHLEYYQTIADTAWGWNYFRYDAVQADSLINQYTAAIVNRKLTVPEGLAQLARRIDALEATGPQLQSAFAQAEAAFRRYAAEAERSSAPVLYPAPPTTGEGSAPVAAPGLLQKGVDGAVTVRGAGTGLYGTADGCTFAGSPVRPSRGVFTCRLTAVAAAQGSIANGAKVGLMARANLGDAAPWAALEVALGRGVHFQARQVAFNGPSDQRPASPGAASGLVGANALLRDNTKPAANYLLRPIWLRLVLDVDQWTAFTSWDGRTWTPAGSPVLCAFVGAWVGLCVTSHASGKFITATFDHLEGFSPAMVVQVGTA